MKSTKSSPKRQFLWILCLLITSGLIGAVITSGRPVQAFAPVIKDTVSSGVLLPGNSTPTELYLPMLTTQRNMPALYGIQIEPINSYYLGLSNQAGLDWLRKNGLLWSFVQPTSTGGYEWDNVAYLNAELLAAQQNNKEIILVIRSTPAWAQLYSGVKCGPMKQSNFDEFGAFLAAAVTRYSAPPYNIEYFEIWNEPDVDPFLVDPDQVFGCWGDNSDPYYGGGYYGQMLNIVYPMMKAANPNVKVLIGGLLLDCDPRNPPAGQTCKPSKFLEGILRAGAKNSFDGVSFHAYDYYSPAFNTYGNPNWGSGKLNNEPNGVMVPVGIKKAGFIEQVLTTFGATGKFLMNTETALICGGANDPPGLPGCDASDTSPYELLKQYYAAQSFAQAFQKKLRANFWFTMHGWRNSGLVYSGGGGPRPAYYSIDFSEEMLGEAVYVGGISTYANVQGYEFSTPDYRELWILWATNGSTVNITLPETPVEIWDSDGDPVAVTGTSLSLSIEPYYIQMP